MRGGWSWVSCRSKCLFTRVVWSILMSSCTFITWSLQPTMDILNFIRRIGTLGLFVVSLLPFATGILGTFLSMGRDGKPLLTKFGVRCLYFRIRGRFPHLVHFPFSWLSSLFEYLLVLILLRFATKARPSLKRQYQEQVQAALYFSHDIDDFNEFDDP